MPGYPSGPLLGTSYVTTMGSDKCVLVGDADLPVMLPRGVCGLFACQPLTLLVGLVFRLSRSAIVKDGLCACHWIR